jgi:hypothetical protein
MDSNGRLKKYLEDTLDKAFIYSLMLYQAEVYNNRLKMCFKLPLILTGAAMSIVNSNFEGDAMKLVNIIFNIGSSVILSISIFLAFEAKEQEFANAKKKFIKLSTEIEQKLISSNQLEESYVFACIEKYNTIEENLDYQIPQYILSRTRKKWATKKALPIIINGIEKERSNVGQNQEIVVL